MRTKEYLKIWIKNNGPIPKDSSGRSFEIHHVNGDHSDNRIENLKLVSIEEHYAIHLERRDFNACRKILKRMKLSPTQNSKMSSEIMTQYWSDKEATKQHKANIKAFANSEEGRRIRSKAGAAGARAGRGHKWWTNGVHSVKSFVCPDGYQHGRTL
jgi:hypothetical protein